jgi:hypothetical protein
MSDKETYLEILNMTPTIQLNMKWFLELDKYGNKSRAEMEQEKLWSIFLKNKMRVMLKALENEPDTLFLDSDMVILDEINDIDKNKSVGLSPQFIREKNVNETGYYNAGMLWSNKKEVCEYWKEITEPNHSCAEQINMKKLEKYDYFEFGENYNLHSWRFILGLESTQQIANNIIVKNNKLYYKDKRLKTIHTHFNAKNNILANINEFLLSKLRACKSYKELCCINRGKMGKWEIYIPKQPRSGLWFHKNDSFRELAVMWGLKHKDVGVIMSNLENCMLFPEIFLYDRPTLEWINRRLINSDLLMLGNGDVMKEGKRLIGAGVNVKPWIFWPRRPMLLEEYIKKTKIKSYEERENKITFIGNIENSIQKKYREDKKWEDLVDNYHCTKGLIHKFSQEEYLECLYNSKYGLCLRGYGSKCHREVELMALGTVPIITEEVTVASYINPLIENIHYIKINNISEWKEPTKEEWERMSKECVVWYNENVHSDKSWRLTIRTILYT